MTLCIRDIFQWRDTRWRYVGRQNEWAYVIDLNNPSAWPERVRSSELTDCERESTAQVFGVRESKPQWDQRVEGDWARLQRILNSGVDLFDPAQRQRCLEHCAPLMERCARTLGNHLQRYWRRGMTKSALLPDFSNCGRHEGGETMGRGRYRRDGRNIFQIKQEDYPKLQAGAEYYLGDFRRSIQAALQWLWEEYYTYEDGAGKKFIVDFGQRPTRRQFTHYINRTVPREKRLRKRHGEKEYQREHKPTLSDTIRDCLGIGHCYEIDATICDVPIVDAADRATIIGKATLYLIVDRKSRLIVGFYVGLENARWETAVEAILSLVESKKIICERYGVPYDPGDWPADGILPMQLLGDHAEMISKNSTRLADNLGVTISNPPALLPNFKPNVETRFKLITADLRSSAPGYDPPENFGKRRRKKYDKEVALTLRELIAEVLEAIIKHNRTPLTIYRRSHGEIMREVQPSPIELWNDGERQTGCLGRRFDEETVRTGILPRAIAKITQDGLLFRNLYYTSEDRRLIRAFTKAREGREPIEVSYDRRSVDCIYVHMPDAPC